MTFDPNEERDPHSGRWTRGSGASVETHVEPGLKDPRVLDVGGDEWNRKTAERLEKEYADVRPEIDKIAQDGVAVSKSDWKPVFDQATGKYLLQASNGSFGLSANGVGNAEFSTEAEATAAIANYAPTQSLMPDEEDVVNHEDDEPPEEPPEDWDALSNDQQEEAEQKYIDQHLDGEKDYQAQNWYDNGEAVYAAKSMLANDDNFKSDWLADHIADNDITLPFPADELANAITIKWDGGEYSDDPEITVDPKFMENVKNELVKTDVENIVNDMVTGFNKKAENKSSSMDVPDWVYDGADESLADSWSSKSDSDKFKYAKDNVDSLQETQKQDIDKKPEPAPAPLAWPTKFDPLNKTSGLNYMRTQALAKYIADKRGAELITKRLDPTTKAAIEKATTYGGGKSFGDIVLSKLREADEQLWSGWKGSSTNADGRLLQVAASDELGGRIREAKPGEPVKLISATEVLIASQKFTDEKSTPAEKAEAKALLEKAAVQNQSPYEQQRKNIPEFFPEKFDNGHIRLPDVNLERNGAASTTVSQQVANNWNGTTNNAPQGIDKKESIAYANKEYSAIGGYEGVKAALRAKWETTQYLLDKADIPIVQAYRGIMYEHKLKGETDKGEFNPPSSGIQMTKNGKSSVDLTKQPVGFTFETQSGKTITKVGEDTHYHTQLGKWEYSQPQTSKQRIVLRAEVPRTAVVSVPAYGQNVHSEQEVVVVGTAWRGWEAWSGPAPSFEDVPLHAKVGYHKPVHLTEADKKLLDELNA